MTTDRFTSTPVDQRTLSVERHRIGSLSTGQRQHLPLQPMHIDRPRSARMLAILLILMLIVYPIGGAIALVVL